jgi:periplasmic protein TonB
MAKRASLDRLGEAELHAAASKAIREQRIYSPAGDNAIEIYIALLGKFPENDAAKVALLELQPYAVIATEQSLQRDDLAEASRLIALINAADPDASALPRLRDEGLRREKLLAAVAATPALAPETASPPVSTSAPAPMPAVSAVAVVAKPTSPVAAAVDKPVAAASPAPPAASPASPPAPSAPTRQPTLVRDAAPRYPAMALRRGIEGSVELAFTIGADGAVSDVRVVRGSPAGTFDEAALAVTRQWKFEATGQSVPGRRTIAFNLPKPAP